ncbi:hypothetical protein B0T18DRAFT_466791, partial [Schizothecium vesticola]
GVFWPRDLLPFDLPNVRVLTFGYDANIATISSRRANNSIFTTAQDLVVRLAATRESLDGLTPLIFVAHSLGGIVVKEVSSDALRNGIPTPRICTFGIAFFGTPHRGSDFASLGQLVARIAGLGLAKEESYMLRALEQGSPELEKIADSFSRLLPRSSKGLAVYSFQEGLPISNLGGKVVESYSSIIGDAFEGKSVINADHMAMCRFTSRDDTEYRLVISVFRRWIAQIGKGKAVVGHSQPQAPNPPLSPGPLAHPGLDKDVQSRAATNTEEISLQNPHLLENLIPSVPHRNFCGRGDELSWIKTAFAQAKKAAGTQRLAVLYGLGGVGKTQIGLRYAFQESSSYRAIFWIDASTEVSIEYSFVEIAQRLVDWAVQVRRSAVNFTRIGYDLGLASVVDPATGQVVASDVLSRKTVVNAIRRWLARPENEGWMLAFDNADDLEAVSLPGYFPRTPNGDILITSRQTQSILLGPSLEVKPLPVDDSGRVLQQVGGGYEAPEDQRFCRLIAEELGGLPLAVVQAGSYLATVKISPKEYLQLYKAQSARLLRNRPPMSVWNYQYTVFSTWEVSFAILEKTHAAAARLLQICSFLNAQSIPYAILATASRMGGRRANIWNTLYEHPVKALLAGKLRRLTRAGSKRPDGRGRQLLSPIPTIHQLFSEDFGIEHGLQAIFELSLASENANNDGLGIHPLVQTWCQNRERGYDSCYELQPAEEALLCVARVLDQLGAHEPLWLQASFQLPNCVSILSGFVVVPDHKLDINLLHAIDVIGRTLQATETSGQETAFAHLHNALGRVRGPRHVLTLEILGRLATAVEATSPERAEELHRRVYRESVRSLGQMHTDTETASHNLGANLILQNKWRDAEAVLSPVHKYRVSQHSSTLKTLRIQCNLAVCAAGLGRTREAEILLQDIILKCTTDAHDDGHFLHLQSQSHANLALVYCINKQWDEAETSLLAAVAHTEKHFGPTHPYTIVNLLALDRLYRGMDLGIVDVPKPPLQLKKCLAAQARLAQLWDHLDLELKSRISFTSFHLYYMIGDVENAEIALDRFEEALIRNGEGEFMEISETEITLSRGLAQWDRGQLPEAILSCADAVRRYQGLVPRRERDMVIAMANLGAAYREAGDPENAKIHLAQARHLQTQLNGDNSKETLWLDTHIAMVHLAAGELDEAQRLLEQTQARLNEHLLPLEKFNLLNQYAMACLHEAKGDVEEAIRLAKRTLDAKIEGMGLDQTGTLKTALMLARLYRSVGRLNEARDVADLIRPYSQYW